MATQTSGVIGSKSLILLKDLQNHTLQQHSGKVCEPFLIFGKQMLLLFLDDRPDGL